MKTLQIGFNETSEKDAIDLISSLMKVTGALDYSGDASIQVLLPLASGGYLRIGVTDDDVANKISDEYNVLWADRYEGLPIVGETNLQTGKKF